ncbi:TlpA family protein disulfide reductase [Actinomadura madurae]|uniref:TlpA family protein disulfide reductase n=1 Tax=Actinomadura madurae TaxID=1993 RepID=UPI002026E1DF|nr:redoxin family protein [Actinomadura madurae]MCP9950960.1 redoxin family protein [Actinomadura madurae]MCP9967748.1 redoxin family protein [Actinomadura madurae]MCP9980195.1 redoxin family protein [Actinomadura madurae]MCQ0008280.1 redoxin family protein [Actinomadura madurae]MCQ0016407.1 redoxin family protein [Actinomadura madurae]
MKMFSLSLSTLAIVLTACGGETAEPGVAASSATVSAPTSAASSKAPVKEAPALLRFQGAKLDGTAFDGKSLAGRPVVLWFWAPWCPKCQAEGPAVAKAAQKYGDKVAFVGVAGLDKDKAAMERFVSRTGTSGIVQLDDRTGALYKHFKVTSQSSYLIVNPEGGSHPAVGPLDEAKLSSLIDKHAL